jgi:hypothetical protein
MKTLTVMALTATVASVAFFGGFEFQKMGFTEKEQGMVTETVQYIIEEGLNRNKNTKYLKKDFTCEYQSIVTSHEGHKYEGEYLITCNEKEKGKYAHKTQKLHGEWNAVIFPNADVLAKYSPFSMI